MTAPAPALLPRTAAPERARDAARAAAAATPRASETPGFAAHLARESAPSEEAPDTQQCALQKPVRSPENLPAPRDTPEVTTEPGKAPPLTRQKLATSPAALLAIATAQAAVEDDNKPAAATANAMPATDAPDAVTGALPLALPGAALLPLPAPAPPATTIAPAGATPTSAIAPAPQKGPRPAAEGAPATPAAQSAHPAAFAVTSLALEREATAPAPHPAQPPATPDQTAPQTAAQTAARAQPSTLAALTGAPAPERPVAQNAARKFRTEADISLPSAKGLALPVPDTAGALAQAQPSVLPTTTPGTATASTPQPISFDQLVDSIARARDGIEPAGPVSVAMRHAEFGRISLRIEGDAAGLSVAMTSPDPAFAPAVAAAHAAAVTAEPARTPSAEPHTGTPDQTLTQGQGQGQGQGSGQQRQNANAPAGPRPAANPVGASASAAERRGGIFA